ncbi:hypothetical protein G6F46_005960 [Rhizopus delemar]|nr:hypothetical protein G6F55_008936 [Rhizopus delemar]KAG1540230.1 hypothetical protein G6F51_008648 [Rhizopus arrhizus]KAG1495347.1 hypothetical protein G6F54_007239 [Rhizopus delemar]KAG1523862.1 hypothetical protein G6F52_004670 [Rhizopus delemar]KAG1558747.1 hypothetical protein G6F49_004217 [Rhizopus delemar]
MGNQLSTKKKYQQEKSSSKSFSSQTDSSHVSTICQPKLPIEYIFPLNDAEVTRLHGQHYLFKHLFQGNYFAPIEPILKNDSKVLDIGCGPHAIWMIDMAIDFPECQFYGFDVAEPISLNEVEKLHKPDNCFIERADVFDGFSYEPNAFDFVHQRLMYNVYPHDKIPWMLQEILRVTKPNGWIELVEPDLNPKRAGPLFTTLMKAVNQLVQSRLGKPFQGKDLVNHMVEAGLREIKSDYGSLPCCWGGYIGKLMYEDLLIVFQHYGPHIHEYLDPGSEFDREKYETMIDTAFDECAEYQTFINIRWAYGKKVVSSAA